MFTDIHIETGPMLDLAIELETQARHLLAAADRHQERRTELLQSTSGAASQGASIDMQTAIDALYIRAGKLKNNAGVLRSLAAVYDQADLDGARSFGP